MNLNFALTILLAVGAAPAAGDHEFRITPKVETEAVETEGDAADDPAVWVDRNNPAESRVLGTDKKRGIAVFDLEGKVVQFLADGQMNNIDVKYDFPLAGKNVDIAMAAERKKNVLALYKYDAAAKKWVEAAARPIKIDFDVYGTCLYKSRTDQKYYAFVNSKKGQIEQWELFDAEGKIDARKVRSLKVDTQTEGCVADDELGVLYIGEEARGVWKFSAEANGSATGTLVDSTKEFGGRLTPDVEGLTIVVEPNGTGLLVVSSQGSDEYFVYQRQAPNAYLGQFKVVDFAGIDGTSGTDGVDAESTPLGPKFPNGVLVIQDDVNDGKLQNFKLIDLRVLRTGLTTRCCGAE
ncbi:MAG: phytase [Planctomycetia bacterium]